MQACGLSEFILPVYPDAGRKNFVQSIAKRLESEPPNIDVSNYEELKKGLQTRKQYLAEYIDFLQTELPIENMTIFKAMSNYIRHRDEIGELPVSLRNQFPLDFVDQYLANSDIKDLVSEFQSVSVELEKSSTVWKEFLGTPDTFEVDKIINDCGEVLISFKKWKQILFSLPGRESLNRLNLLEDVDGIKREWKNISDSAADNAVDDSLKNARIDDIEKFCSAVLNTQGDIKVAIDDEKRKLALACEYQKEFSDFLDENLSELRGINLNEFRKSASIAREISSSLASNFEHFWSNLRGVENLSDLVEEAIKIRDIEQRLLRRRDLSLIFRIEQVNQYKAKLSEPSRWFSFLDFKYLRARMFYLLRRKDRNTPFLRGIAVEYMNDLQDYLEKLKQFRTRLPEDCQGMEVFGDHLELLELLGSIENELEIQELQNFLLTNPIILLKIPQNDIFLASSKFSGNFDQFKEYCQEASLNLKEQKDCMDSLHSLNDVLKTWNDQVKKLKVLTGLDSIFHFSGKSIQEVQSLLEKFKEEKQYLNLISRRNFLREKIRRNPILDQIIDNILKAGFSAEKISIFTYLVVVNSVARNLMNTHREKLEGYTSDTLDKKREEFSKLDQQIIELNKNMLAVKLKDSSKPPNGNSGRGC